VATGEPPRSAAEYGYQRGTLLGAPGHLRVSVSPSKTTVEYMQTLRRRYLPVAKWAEYMKDLDMFIGNPQTDVGANAQTGHPCVVVPYKFDVPAQGGGRCVWAVSGLGRGAHGVR
jgi:hypothetical protein